MVQNSNPLNSFCIQQDAKIENAETKEDGLTRVNILGYTGDSVDLSDYGVDAPVVYKVDGIQLAKKEIPYLLEHNSSKPLGHIESASNKNHKVTTLAVHSFPSQESKDVAEAITKNKMPYQASMGLEINVESAVYHEEGAVQVNGRTFNAPVIVIHDSTMYEMSATLFGRDSNTTITKLSKDMLMKIRNNKGGTTVTTPPEKTENKETTPPVTPPVVTPPVVENKDTTPPVVPPTAPPITVPAVTEHNGSPDKFGKFVELRKKYSDAKESILMNAANEGWDDDRITREIKLDKLENSYPGIPGVFTPDNKVDNSFLAHFALSCGVTPEFLEKKLGSQIVQVAHNKPRMSLRESLMLTANNAGGRFNGHSDVENMTKFLKRVHFQNAWSSVDYPNLMHQIGKWVMEEAWLLDPPFAPTICKKLSNSNFNPVGHIRPKGGNMWTGLNKEGKLEHATFGKEDKYTTELGTIGQILTLKREDIINDNIGWIEETLRLMKEGAFMFPDYQLVNLIHNGVAASVQTNSGADQSVFNLPFNAENLEILHNVVKRRNVTKGDKTVNARRSTRYKLVYTSDIERDVWEVLNQEVFISRTDGYGGRLNYWKGKFTPVMFDQLDNTTYNANAKSKSWGLVPESDTYAPYAMTLLNGQEKPTTEIVDLPADELGWGMRGYWDVNLDYRPVENDMLQGVAWSFTDEVGSIES